MPSLIYRRFVMDVRKWEKLKSNVDRMRREADRAVGALSSLTKQLEEEFECSTIADAQKLRDKLKADLTTAEESFEKGLVEFEEEWGEVLESGSS